MTSHRCFAPKGALYFGLLLFLLVPPGARADSVVFSNFGPGIGFDPTIGWVGPAGTAYSVGGVPFDVAVSFTPSSNVDLSQIFLPILWQIPDPPNSTTVTLVNSAGGAPGATVLESWSGLTVPSLSFSPPLTLTSSPDVLLSAGTQYWIVVGTEGSDFWFQNNSGGTQPFDFGSGTSWTVIDPSTQGYALGTTSPAYEVTGTAPVPEPTTICLLEFGFLGLAALGLRKKRTAVTLGGSEMNNSEVS